MGIMNGNGNVVKIIISILIVLLIVLGAVGVAISVKRQRTAPGGDRRKGGARRGIAP